MAKSKRRKRAQERNEKHELAVNTQLVFWGALTLLFGIISVSCLVTEAVLLGVLFALFAALGVFILSVSPLYYLFSARGVQICYFWGKREVIAWGTVRYVTRYGAWFVGRQLPHYEIAYPNTRRGFFGAGEIAKTRKTARLLAKYYKGKINE